MPDELQKQPPFTEQMQAEIAFERERLQRGFENFWLPRLRPDIAVEVWTKEYVNEYIDVEVDKHPALYFLYPVPEHPDLWLEDLQQRAIDFFTQSCKNCDLTPAIKEKIQQVRSSLSDKVEEYYWQKTCEIRLLNHLESARERLMDSPNDGIMLSQIEIDGEVLKACREVLSEQARDKLKYFIKEKGLSREAFRAQIGDLEESLIQQLHDAWPKDLAERMRPFRSDFQFARYKERLQALAGPVSRAEQK